MVRKRQNVDEVIDEATEAEFNDDDSQELDEDSYQKPHPHKYFHDQFDDEEVLYVFRKHPIVMRKGIILWALGMLAGPMYILALSFIYQNDPSKFPTPTMFLLSMVASFILATLLIAPSYIGWYFSIFIITDQRFLMIKQKGLFHRGVSDVGIHQIQSVNYEVAGLQETLLGFGTIKIQTYVGDVDIHEVHHPAKIQKRITLILRDLGIAGMQSGSANAGKQSARRSENIVNEEV